MRPHASRFSNPTLKHGSHSSDIDLVLRSFGMSKFLDDITAGTKVIKEPLVEDFF